MSCKLRRMVLFAVAGSALCAGLVPFPAAAQSRPESSAQPQPQTAAQAATAPAGESAAASETEADHVQEREEWFYRQRRFPLAMIPGGARQRALEQKARMREAVRERASRAAATKSGTPAASQTSTGSATWTPIGPTPTVSANASVGLVSGRVTAIAVDPTNAKIVYLGGAQGGIWKSTDGGAHWAPSFDSENTLAIGSIAIDPSSCSPGPCTTLYAGTGEQNFSGDSYYGAGVYKSTDSGATWSQIPGETITNPQAGGPTSFLPPAAPFNQVVGGVHIGTMVVHPTMPKRIFAAVQIFENVGGGAASGLYCTEDGGATWQQLVAGAIGTDVAVHAIAGIGYAALGSHNGDTDNRDATGENGIFKSSNVNSPCSGQTWTLASKPPIPVGTAAGTIRLGLATSDVTGNTLYAAVATPQTAGLVFNTALAGVFRSVDGGANWTAVTPPADFCTPQCAYDLVVKVHPNDAQTVIVGGSRTLNSGQPFFLLRTNDGGATWQTIATDGATTLHVDQHALAFGFSGAMVSSIFVGNDGGIWSSPLPTPSSPVTWTNLNQTLQLSQFYPGISIDPGTGSVSFGGTQDNGTQKYDAGANPANPQQWAEQAACGDGGYTAIDPAAAGTVYAACQHINIRKSVNSGTDNFPIAADSGIAQGDRAEFIPPLVIDPHAATSNRLYFGTFRVWQTMDGGASWNAISGDLTAGSANSPDVTSLSVSPVNSDVVYAGTSDSRLWRTTNASAGTGATWTELDGGTLPPRVITQVAADPNNQNVVFVTVSGFSGFQIVPGITDTLGHVFRCSATQVSCMDISGQGAGALPNVPVNAIVVDPINTLSAFLYIGTDVGVFGSTDGGMTWMPDFPATPPALNGLPNVAVLSLALQPTARILRAGTHGRGAWDLQLANSAPTLASITPSMGQTGSSVPVTLTGTNFATPFTVLTPSGITATNIMVTDSMTATATLAISPSASLGPNPIAVSDAGGNSGTQTFTVTQGPPTLTAISPSAGAQGGSVVVTLTGTNFIAGTTVNAPAGITASGISVTNATTMTATLAISSTAALGAQNISVNNGVGSSMNVQFTVVPAPTLTSIMPTSATAGTTVQTVTLSGTNFIVGSPFTINCSQGITPNNPTVVNSTTITAAFVIATNAATGQQNVTVTQSGVTTAAVMFTVNAPPPTITSISPVAGTLGSSGIMVTLTGSGFDTTSGAMVTINASPGITVSSTTVASATSITAMFTIASNAATGQQNITVTQASGTSMPGIAFGVGTDFTMTAGAVTPSPVSPGNVASSVLTIMPMTSAPFPTTVSFTCTNLPTLSGCSFSPPNLSPSQGMGGNSTVTASIFTSAPASVGPRPVRRRPWPNGLPAVAVAGLIALLGAKFALRRIGQNAGGPGFGRPLQPRGLPIIRYALAVMLIVVLAGLAGACGGSNPVTTTPPGGTPPGTYMITVTAMSGNASHTATITLVVH